MRHSPRARFFTALLSAIVFSSLVPVAAGAQPVRLKDVARVQGVTSNQLVGYGIVTGLNQSGDSTSVVFTSKTVQNVLQTFGLTTTSQDVRTRNVAAVVVTASLPPFAHSGDTADVTVSSLGDATSLQGGTLVLSELRAANNLVYATAQGPVSVGGFSAGDSSGLNSVSKNHVTAGRIPQGAVIARDMITNIQQDAAGFSYVLTTPDFKTAARVAQLLNGRFGGGTARANDAATIRVNLPTRYAGDPVDFLADAGDLSVNADALAKVVVNERTGTVVMAATSPWRPARSRTATSRSRSRPRTPSCSRGRSPAPRPDPDQHPGDRDRDRPQAGLHQRRGDLGPGGAGAQHHRRLAARPDRDRASPARVRLAAGRRGDHVVDRIAQTPPPR